jgi:hypothetical protein
MPTTLRQFLTALAALDWHDWALNLVIAVSGGMANQLGRRGSVALNAGAGRDGGGSCSCLDFLGGELA